MDVVPFFPVRDVEKIIFAQLDLVALVAIAQVSPYCFRLIRSHLMYEVLASVILRQTLCRILGRRKRCPLSQTEAGILRELNPHQLSFLPGGLLRPTPLIREIQQIRFLCRLSLMTRPFSRSLDYSAITGTRSDLRHNLMSFWRTSPNYLPVTRTPLDSRDGLMSSQRKILFTVNHSYTIPHGLSLEERVRALSGMYPPRHAQRVSILTEPED